MPNVVTIGKRLIPLDQIAFVEPFGPTRNPNFIAPAFAFNELGVQRSKASAGVAKLRDGVAGLEKLNCGYEGVRGTIDGWIVHRQRARLCISLAHEYRIDRSNLTHRR